MKLKKNVALLGNMRGVTLLEMILVSMVGVLIIVQVSAIWLSFNKSLRQVKTRIILAQGAQAARALLISDWQRAVNPALNVDNDLILELPADSASSSESGGITHYSHIVTYARSGTNLIRRDNGETSPDSDPWAMTVASHLDHFTVNYVSAPLVSAVYGFKKDGIARDLNIFMVNCDPIPGLVDCGRLLPLFPYYAFLPIASNVVYSSVTATLDGI